jgi:hypothetical protein
MNNGSKGRCVTVTPSGKISENHCFAKRFGSSLRSALLCKTSEYGGEIFSRQEFFAWFD